MVLLSALPPRDVAAAHALQPSVAELVADDDDRSARRLRAALVPELVVRFTYATAAGAAQTAAIDSPFDTWRWPVSLGATIELRALWGFDRAPRRRPAPPSTTSTEETTP